MDVYLQKNGDMNITEYWDVKAEDGSEWFKQIKNINDIEITNFVVSMDGNPLTQKEWNIRFCNSNKYLQRKSNTRH